MDTKYSTDPFCEGDPHDHHHIDIGKGLPVAKAVEQLHLGKKKSRLPLRGSHKNIMFLKGLASILHEMADRWQSAFSL